jgi:chitodextrinase
MSVMAVFGMTVPSVLLWSSPVHASTATLTASADTYVTNNASGTNYGTANPMIASSSSNRTLLKFDTSSITSGTNINSVTLKLYNVVGHNSGGNQVHIAPDSWTESAVTWNSQPTYDTNVVATSTTPAAGSWSSITVPASAVTLGSNTDFLITYSTSGTSHQIASRESGANAPQLIIDYGTASVPSPDVTIAGAGDIVQSAPGGYSYTAAMATGDQILAINPSYVLVPGDGAYDAGTIDDWNTRYSPTWGRFKDKTLPTPGNHEYKTPNAGGYWDYWGSLAHPESNGYYATSVGNGWRIYSLNCGNDTASGAPSCASGSAQISWLQADLAAHSGMRFGAYVHYPRYTGSTEHPDNQDVKPAWDALLAAGADWMMEGHVHNYERFPKMDNAGNLSSTGMRSFVVGTGGAYMKGYGQAAGYDHSELRLDTHFGVMKMVLGANSYTWQFIGSGQCSTVNPTGTYGNTTCPSEAGQVLDSGTEASNNPASGTDSQAPTAPTSLASSNITTTTDTVSWTAASDNVGVTGYQVSRDGVVVGTTAGTSFNDSGLTQSTAYSYTVKAYDAAGNYSAASSALSVTTSAAADTTAPSTPTSLASSNVTATGATLSWTGSTDNVAVTGYQILRDATAVGTTTGTSFNDTGLTAATTYSYTVKAFDAAGNYSSASSAASVTTPQPVQQTTVTLNATADSYVTNNFPTTNYGTVTPMITSASAYRALLKFDTSGIPSGATINSASLGLYNVNSHTSGGNAIHPETDSWTETGVTWNNQPTYDATVLATSTTPTSPNTWTNTTVPTTSVTAAGNTNYVVNYSASGLQHQIASRESGSTTTPQLTVVYTTGDTVAPSTPANLVGSNISSSQATLNWDAASDNVAVTGYQVLRNGTAIATTSTPSYTDTSLSASTSYQYTVKAYDAAGNYSAASTSLTINTTATSDTTAPSAPTSLVASSVTNTGATISWTAATDNVAVTGYQVLRGGTAIANVADVSFIDTGLTAATTYSYTVKAYDAAGNLSAASSALSVTTATKPSFSGMTVTGVTSTTATVTAQVNPNGLTTTANFGYGLTSGLGSGTANQNLGSGTSAVTMNGTITGLSPNTTYYVRAQGSNSAGGTFPTPITFTTAP